MTGMCWCCPLLLTTGETLRKRLMNDSVSLNNFQLLIININIINSPVMIYAHIVN